MTESELYAHYSPVLEQLEDFRWLETGNGQAQCPAHEDRTHSLSVKLSHTGALLCKCHSNKGCTFEQILRKLGRVAQDFFPPKNGKAAAPSKIVEEYIYTDEGGRFAYQSVRCEPKSFFQRRHDPENPGRWLNNLDGVTRYPYHLDALQKAKARNDDPGDPHSPIVCVVEGERKVHALEELGMVATCNAGGGGKWPADFARYFEGLAVAVLPDHDEEGWKHAAVVAANLAPVCPSVRLVTLPGLRLKEDVRDWVRRLGGDQAYQRRYLLAVYNSSPCVISEADADLHRRFAYTRMYLARTLALSRTF